MSAPPYMQLYIADYLADTTHLTTVEHGAYLLLLMALWRAGGKLPKDPAKLARIARLSPAEWAKVEAVVMDFFTVRGGHVTQKRATKELARYQATVEGRKTAGKASAAKRANKINAEAPTNVDVLLEQNPTNQNQNHIGISEAKASSSSAPPDDIRTAFDEWNDLAKRLSLPVAKDLTPDRRKRLKARLAKSGLPGWREALAGVEASDFCRGLKGDFRAGLDFLLQPASFQKLIEGGYGREAPAAPAQTQTLRRFASEPIRQAVTARHGEDFARKWLDSCDWQEVPNRVIRAPNRYVADQLIREARDVLKSLDIHSVKIAQDIAA